MKPINMAIKDFLIRKLSTEIMIPEKIIDAVIRHEFSTAVKALKENNSVEISGLGKFLFKEPKAKKFLAVNIMGKEKCKKFLSGTETDAKKIQIQEVRLKEISDNIEYVKYKLNGHCKDIGGVEKPTDPPYEIKENY
jgi:nucleoid DNA-binding protein